MVVLVVVVVVVDSSQVAENHNSYFQNQDLVDQWLQLVVCLCLCFLQKKRNNLIIVRDKM